MSYGFAEMGRFIAGSMSEAGFDISEVDWELLGQSNEGESKEAAWWVGGIIVIAAIAAYLINRGFGPGEPPVGGPKSKD